mmetsp:Transcript_112699/g.325623  ORF Transcript_112699/g.325623 Transcript_112699/m.325623 type:complete len:979 (-) Transcript_112699:130-3066(-)
MLGGAELPSNRASTSTSIASIEHVPDEGEPSVPTVVIHEVDADLDAAISRPASALSAPFQGLVDGTNDSFGASRAGDGSTESLPNVPIPSPRASLTSAAPRNARSQSWIAQEGEPELHEQSDPCLSSSGTLKSAPTKKRENSLWRRRSNCWADMAMEVLEQDLGVAFCTRAHSLSMPPGPIRSWFERCIAGVLRLGYGERGGRWASKHESLDSRELGRIFPEVDASGSPLSHEDHFLEHNSSPGLRNGRVLFASHTALVRYSKLMLRLSALASFAFVLASVALEPMCVPPETQPVMVRLSAPRLHYRLQAACILAHVLNSGFYAVLSIAGRILFGRVDVRQGEELTDMVDVLSSQLRTLDFWLDLGSLIGFLAELIHVSEAAETEVPTVAHWLMLFQLGKFWRIVMPEVQTSVVRHTFVAGVLWLLCSMGLVAHAAACALITIGTQEMSVGSPSWTQVMFVNGDRADYSQACVAIYTESFYFAALSLTSVGYGDVLVTPLERGVNAAFLLLFQLFCTKVCADLTWLTNTHNYWEAEHQALRAQTWASLQNMQVPPVLRQRVLAFQSYKAKVHREDLNQPIFNGLSANLIAELRLCAYRNLVLQAVFLREQPKQIIRLIVGSVVDEVFLPADFILRCGGVGRELYFVRRGSAAVYIGTEPPIWGVSTEVASYVVGNYFGELAMLTGKPRAAWVMASTYCVCTVLPYSAVEKLAQDHPGAFTKLVQSMISAYNLKASMRWEDVLAKMQAKYCFNGPEESFTWLCAQGGDIEDEHLTAKAFEEGMRRLKVPQLDRKIFWAQMDMDSSGEVSFEEFLENMPDEPRYPSTGGSGDLGGDNLFWRKTSMTRGESAESIPPSVLAALLCGGRSSPAPVDRDTLRERPELESMASGSSSPVRKRPGGLGSMEHLEAALVATGRWPPGRGSGSIAAALAAAATARRRGSDSSGEALPQLLDELAQSAAQTQRLAITVREHLAAAMRK